MRHFPEKLNPSRNVSKRRIERRRNLVYSASWGVFIRILIIAFELCGVWLYGSSALLLDALASIVDVVSSLLLILFIRLADRPPDRSHPFGHGRYEPLVGLQLGLLLLVVGVGMFFRQLFLFHDIPLEEAINSRAWVFPVVAVILLEICYRVVSSAAKKQNSPAMIADAFHYRIDAITSLFAAIALVFGALYPQLSQIFDHVGALIIALLMIVLGGYASRENMNQLLDHAPDPSLEAKVRAAAMRAKGVLGTEKLGILLYGPDAHVDIDVEVEPSLTVLEAHEISQRVRVEIQNDWPAVRDVIVHIEPYYPNDH